MKGDPPGPGAAEAPASVYVHIPFCKSKCPYCSFVSAAGQTEEGIRRYGQALLVQLEEMAAHPWTRERGFASLFLGGGTPTMLETGHLTALCESFLNRYPLAGEVEISLEANPNTVSRESLSALRQAGFNRLSIGIQSFSDHLLKTLGRSHSAADGLDAVSMARRAGFDVINLDLMYGLPGQTPELWQETLAMALSLAPEHLALYELTIEQGTPYGNAVAAKTLRLPAEDMVLAMEEITRELIDRHGFERYEISNYSRPGFRCCHNINYWRNGSYLGCGAGAVSSFSGARIRSVEGVPEYIEMIRAGIQPFAEAECLDLNSRFRETVIMGLRMVEGISHTRLTEQFGFGPRQFYGQLLPRLVEDGLLEDDGKRLRLSARGMAVANTVLSELV